MYLEYRDTLYICICGAHFIYPNNNSNDFFVLPGLKIAFFNTIPTIVARRATIKAHT